MHRQDVIQDLVDAVTAETIIVSNIADASWELCAIRDRPRNFYMLGSFGLASSIALGLALSTTAPVVALDGDGALLFNLGALATEGRYAPPGLVHVVVDNGAHGATGYQPTATASGADLAAAARALGLRATTVADRGALRGALEGALRRGEHQVVVAKVDERPPTKAPLPPYSGPEIRDRFMAALRA